MRRKLGGALPAPLTLLALRAYRVGRHGALKLLVALHLQQGAFGRSPDLVHPARYTDKIRWRMLYDRRPILHMCSDRLAAREYVGGRAGEKYLVPLLGVFDRPEQVPWAELEPPYVVKATHGCGWNIFVRDPGEVDPARFRQVLEGWLKTDYYHVNWEWSYKNVPRRIMVERFIGTGGKVPPDFKVYCFDGEPRAISVCHDRYTTQERWTWRDPSWNVLTLVSRFFAPGAPTAPPARLGEMMEVSRAVSRDFDHVRVDLYCVGDHVYFGELTTTQAAGGWPHSDAGEAWLGSFWRLPRRADVRRGSVWTPESGGRPIGGGGV